MDQLWLAAPAPAIKLWPETGPAGWRLNAAALRWSRRHGLDDAALRALAEQLLLAQTPTVASEGRVAALALAWKSLPFDAGWLVWLVPEDVQNGASGATGVVFSTAADKLDLVQEFGRLGLFERDVRSGEGHWDAHMFRLFGLEPAVGPPDMDKALERVHPEDRERFRTEHLRFTRAPGRYTIHFRVVLPDTSVRDLQSMLEVRAGSDGRPAVMYGVIVDGTEGAGRVRAQEAIAAELGKALQLAKISVWRIDLESQRIHFNEAGYGPGGRGPRVDHTSVEQNLALVHPDDVQGLLTASTQAAQSDGVVDVEARYRRANGEYRHMLTRRVAEQDANGRVIALLGMSMDQTVQITERERAHALARRIELVAEAAGVGIWSVEPATGAVEWNAQMFAIYGRPPEHGVPALSVWLGELVHPEDRGWIVALQDDALEWKSDVLEIEFRLLRPDGSLRWVVSRSRREWRDGRALHAGVQLDTTESIRQRLFAEQALSDKQTAERANQAKSEFLARISHELRTPLNAVLGFAQLIEQDARHPLPGVQLERVARIRSAGEHLLALIADVLDLAAIEAGTLPLVVEAVAIDAVLKDVAQWVSAPAHATNVRLHLEPTTGWVRADARRLRQIVANLASNAVKYNHAGGQVWFSAQATPDAGWEISVRDDGRGLTSEQCEHLFESFNRLGADREGIEGTGIGLAIVRQLADCMGGRVTVQSEPGRGSTFSVWLPCAEAQAPPSVAGAAQASPSPSTLRPLSVLYIEDNPVNVILVEELVAMRANVRLSCASDGLSGVARALDECPDVLLIDMQLPDIDGFEVLRRLRAAPALARCVKIALSANGMSEDIGRARAAGFDDYWTKPIDFKRFLVNLDALAGAPSAG
ncbi:MAG: PAS domain-containing protein [Burkholderiales bacterium]|nr:PAS domain-containing protein [Burkholderiales bacterium]